MTERVYYNYEEMTPGPICTEMKKCWIISCIWIPDLTNNRSLILNISLCVPVMVMQQRESWIWSWESRKAPKRRQQRNETIVRDTSGIQRREDELKKHGTP